jgi:hypothetical protein
MGKDLDSIIKDALADETGKLSDSEEGFDKIKEEIKNGKGGKKYKYALLSFGMRKSVSVFACFLAVSATLLFSTSSQARGLASQAIESITTLFVMEKKGDDLQIVQKPSNEVMLTSGVSSTTFKSDEALGKILGFDVHFPGTLDASSDSPYQLNYKCLGVVLGKQLDYDVLQGLEAEMLRAVTDDEAFGRLSPYKPFRDVTGAYKKADGSTFFINLSDIRHSPGIAGGSWPESNDMESGGPESSESESGGAGAGRQKVRIGGCKGYWETMPVPVYPTVIENNVGKSDMTAKPVIKEVHTLMWENPQTVFILNTDRNLELTLEEALGIAEEFMKNYNN